MAAIACELLAGGDPIPVGLCGELRSTARVRGVTARPSASPRVEAKALGSCEPRNVDPLHGLRPPFLPVLATAPGVVPTHITVGRA